jgi:hypothetical protein
MLFAFCERKSPRVGRGDKEEVDFDEPANCHPRLIRPHRRLCTASARPHLDHVKIGDQMDQIGAKAGLGPTYPVVDAQ